MSVVVSLVILWRKELTGRSVDRRKARMSSYTMSPSCGFSVGTTGMIA